MKKYLVSFTILTISLIFAIGSTEHAHAYSSASPNAITEDSPENFRRSRGMLIRYQRNKRAISRRRNADENDYNTSTGSTSTFDRRADVLRKAQLQRIKEDIDTRAYSNSQSRTKKYLDRSEPTTLRRIRRALNEGGVRHGLPSQDSGETPAEKLKRKRLLQQEYRNQNRVKQQARARANMQIEGCTGFSGRRYANCLYRQQNEN